MKHMGLFEGIGGFSLAAMWANWQTPVMVEWNPYCQAVLKKNFPDAAIFSDIRNFDGRPYAGQIDIITGGFPCQPFSHAGKRGGETDDRYLWPEMLRIIDEVRPAWVVGENVAGLVTMDGGRVLAGILADLENEGYIPEVFVIPALAVGAPHRRERVWIVAHSINNERNRGRETRDGRGKSANENCGVIANAANVQGSERHRFASQRGRKKEAEQIGMGNCNPANADKPGLEKRKGQQGNNGPQRQTAIGNIWAEHWYEVATRICRVDDGLSGGLDGTGKIPAKKNTGKAYRLEALGNAIVPQVAYQIFEAINKIQ